MFNVNVLESAKAPHYESSGAANFLFSPENRAKELKEEALESFLLSLHSSPDLWPLSGFDVDS